MVRLMAAPARMAIIAARFQWRCHDKYAQRINPSGTKPATFIATS